MDSKILEQYINEGLSTRQIAAKCNVSKSTVSYYIHKYNLTDDQKYKKTQNFRFNKIDTKEKAYVLGFILADGSISQTNLVDVDTCLNDKEVIEFVSIIIHSNVHYSHRLNKKKRIFPKCRTNKKINDITKFTGGRLKQDRHYPRVKDNLEKYLIQGLFDADGCITWGRRKDRNRIWQKVSFCSQLKILEGVQKFLINKLHISTVIRPKKNEDCYILEFSNRNDVLKFCDYIYCDNFIILHRKYLTFKALRLELEENDESNRSDCQYRAEPVRQEGVETSGVVSKQLNNRISIQDYRKVS